MQGGANFAAQEARAKSTKCERVGARGRVCVRVRALIFECVCSQTVETNKHMVREWYFIATHRSIVSTRHHVTNKPLAHRCSKPPAFRGFQLKFVSWSPAALLHSALAFR
eukprot:3954235-Alexandrium_andersonii.AAC.2